MWPFKKKEPLIRINHDEKFYNEGYNDADSIMKRSPRSVAIITIHNKSEGCHPMYQQGMLDRLNKE